MVSLNPPIPPKKWWLSSWLSLLKLGPSSGEGSPTKIDYQKIVGTLILTSLLDLVELGWLTKTNGFRLFSVEYSVGCVALASYPCDLRKKLAKTEHRAPPVRSPSCSRGSWWRARRRCPWPSPPGANQARACHSWRLGDKKAPGPRALEI